MTAATTPSIAYEHNGQRIDSAAFYAIACDPRRHVAVQACAGAGKTWMLVSRIIRALLDGAQPHEILAITFTKKAAGEMRQRLHAELALFARADDATLTAQLQARGVSAQPQEWPALRQRLKALYPDLLTHGRALQVRTFHSWFAALLRAAPLQLLDALGLPLQYELLEDTSEAEAELWHRRFLPRVAADAALRADYAALVGSQGRHKAHAVLQAALGKRVEFALADQAKRVDNAVSPFGAIFGDLAAFSTPAEALDAPAARQCWLDWARALGAESAKTPQNAANAVVSAFNGAQNADDRLAALRKAFFVKDENRLTKHLQKYAAAQAAEPELARLLDAQAQHQARQYHLRAARLTRALLAEFAALKRERNWIDMGDLERVALALLSSAELAGWIQQRLDARVRHLLIDEFQDTNPLQWHALHNWLSAYAGAGGGAQQAPRLFIVGDPKQSIYRFRRADPQVFAAAQDFVAQALGGDRLACDHTRRNAPAVLATVNAVMKKAQDDGEMSDFRVHTTQSDAEGGIWALPLIARPERAARTAADAPLPPWRDSLLTAQTEPETRLRQRECRQAAHWVAQQLARGAQPGQIMVLARKREALGALQQELRALGIACEQPEAQLLAEQPAAQDVLALVEALTSPGNDLALARALKSPLFDLRDSDLMRLALERRTAENATPHASAPHWLDLLARGVALDTQDAAALLADLQRYRHWLLSLPPHDALQHIYQHRDVLARFAAAAPAPQRAAQVAHLQALLGAALQVQGGRFLSACQWLRALRRAHLTVPFSAAATSASESAAPSEQSVRLLTVHGAKGLEADTVLLLDACAQNPQERGPGLLLDWPAQASAPRRLAFVAQTSAPPPCLRELAASESAAQARENVNLLYVAMTRARQRLVLSAFEPHQTPAAASPNWWQRIQPLAQPLPAPAPESARTLTEEAAPQPFILKTLPPAQWASATPTQSAQTAVSDAPRAPQASSEAAGPAKTADGGADGDSDAARIGQAMHWLLEHAARRAQNGLWPPALLHQAARRFALTAAQGQQAHALARRILDGEGAWAWQSSAVAEAFDEVELLLRGQRLRIDRLVRRRAVADQPETWWVLDYKSAHQPERDAALQAQLARYRAAVQAIYPGQPVRAAFLSADGRLRPLAADGDGAPENGP
ncbi:MAG: UvrD-helicase domain-containing protein [Burkholderiaceae bacterium]|jgi:ATP-dependent helicase/nuclease subunit A|nr:UvrD-helicase domain-containing protein [Burkholderiaceae bacterium]